MSTSLLYHGWGLRGYRYRGTTYLEGQIVFSVEMRQEDLRCPICRRAEVTCKGTILRWLKTVPIGRKGVLLEIPVQRVECRECEVIQQVRLGIADPYRSYTRAFERYALDLSRSMTIQAVARHLGVSWDVVKDIQKRHLERKYRRPNLKNLRRIAIDEISIGKGHRYLTIVMNWETGQVVFVGEGKKAESLEGFWRMLGRRKKRIKAVAIDMSGAYIEAVTTHLPQAALVFDHFHVVQLFNQKLSDLRRDVQREAQTKLQKDVLKGTRWLLLKNPQRLEDKRKERERLEEALRLNKPLATAYYMKEDLRQMWDQPDKSTAHQFLVDWIRRAEASGIKMLIQFAKTLALHRRGILAYYDYPISTGRLEGTNNKIKTMKRQAYGFRDTEFLKLKILNIHESRYELVG